MNFNNINISFGNQIIYKNFSINIEDKKITAIIGESGIGKTSLLEYISQQLIKEKIDFSYVFQENRLVQWKTVRGNLELVFDKSCIISIEDSLKIVGLNNCDNKYPFQLSGGMKQRVNLARAILKPGKIMILDEPFKSIDNKNKNEIIQYLKRYITSNDITCVFVTHDNSEAKIMADSIIEL